MWNQLVTHRGYLHRVSELLGALDILSVAETPASALIGK